MDFKRIIILLFCFLCLLSSCKKKSLNMDNERVVDYCGIVDNTLTIRLNNTNKQKPIGEINYMEFENKGFKPETIIYTESDVLISQHIPVDSFDYSENKQNKIYIRWYGGSLTIYVLYSNNNLSVVKERYKNRI